MESEASTESSPFSPVPEGPSQGDEVAHEQDPIAPRSVWNIVGWCIAVVASAVHAVSYGFSYGCSNELTYLVSALRVVHPDLLGADWFATQTTHYHPGFTYLAALLLKLDGRGWAIAITDVLLTFGGMLFTYWATQILSGRRLAPAVFLLLVCFAYVSRTNGVGVSYVFGGLFQPSSLGSFGLLASLPFWLAGRYLASGICLALGGLFHANYLLLGFPLFGFAHLLIGTSSLVRRGIRQLGPSCISLVVLSPAIFASVGTPKSTLARELFLKMRSPHHYVPATFERAFSPFVGFQVLAIALGIWLLSDGRAHTARFGALLASLFSLLWVGTILTTVTYMPAVAQLFVWRFAPYSDLWCQLLICLSVVVGLVNPSGLRKRLPNHALALTAVGLGFLLMYFGDRKEKDMLALLGGVGLALLLPWLFYGLGQLPDRFRLRQLGPWPRVGTGVVTALAVVALSVVSHDVVAQSKKASFLLRGYSDADEELHAWMRAKTAKDAQFLHPPDMDALRYQGQRAIVVDWKSAPLGPSEFLEWRSRIADVVGKTPETLTGQRDLSGYAAMDQARLDRLKQKYKLDYVVLRRGRERGLSGKVAFRNHGFVVLKL